MIVDNLWLWNVEFWRQSWPLNRAIIRHGGLIGPIRIQRHLRNTNDGICIIMNVSTEPSSSTLHYWKMTTAPRSSRSHSDAVDMLDHDDPLSKALMPPKDESPAARIRRLQMQQEATRVSQEIDDTIQESRKAYEKRKKAIKILLLGAVWLQNNLMVWYWLSFTSCRPGWIWKKYYVEKFVESITYYYGFTLIVCKDFQLAFTPNHFRTERAAWKTIIQLNLIG